jgi:hypothetical protein
MMQLKTAPAIRQTSLVVALVAASVVTAGCIPKSMVLKSRDLQAVEVGFVSDGNGDKILLDDDAVDQIATGVIELMEQSGFVVSNTSTSFGLQPWTGHTRNVYFQLADNKGVRCIFEVSKKVFKAEFDEVEVTPQSDDYSTSDADVLAVRQAAIALNEFATENFPGRSVRVAVFNNPMAADAGEN